LPEALARTRHDSVLSAPARPTPRKGRPHWAAATLRRLLAFPARGYVGAAFAAVLTGIVINALTLQHARHPAPFFAAHPPAAETPAPAAAPTPPVSPFVAPTPPAPPPPVPAARTDEPAAAALPPPRPAALPPSRPTDLGAAPAASPHGVDAIGALLRERSAKEEQKELLEAQNALVKLGYVLKADGAPSAATAAALRDFERAHALPLATDMSPRLLKRLLAAVADAER
jgi:hypothetical protein